MITKTEYDIFDYLKKNPGSSATQMGFGVFGVIKNSKKIKPYISDLIYRGFIVCVRKKFDRYYLSDNFESLKDNENAVISPPVNKKALSQEVDKVEQEHKPNLSGMHFRDIIDALLNRQFVTRKGWCGNLVLVYELERQPYIQVFDKRRFEWVPSMEDLGANDWEILPCKWTGVTCDYKPFNEKILIPKGWN